MPIARIENLGSRGVNRDQPDWNLPPEVLSTVQNARFLDGAAHKIEGERDMFGALSIEPHVLIPWKVGANYYYVYANASAIYRHDGGTESDITRTSGAYAAGSKPKWTGGVFQGILVLNNDAWADYPQSWDGTANMEDLPNWPANTYARILRPFDSFLIAIGIQDSGNDYDYLIMWSDAASPGSVPSSWSPAADNFAGDSPKLAATGDLPVDAFPLGNILFIYKEDTIYKMQYVGRPTVFQIRPAFGNFGLLSKNGVVAFKNQHLVLSKNDIIIHNGQSWNSVASRKVRRNIFSVMDNSNYDTSFAVLNHPYSEVWICYPEQGESYPSVAAIWNYETDTWSFRELPGVRCATPGLDTSAASGTTFDAVSGTFDDQTGIFDELPYNPAESQLILGSSANSKLYRADITNQFDGTNFKTQLERLALPVAGTDRHGQVKVDLNSYKMFNRIRPKMSGIGATVKWYFGVQDTPNGTVSWEGPFNYTIGTDEFIDYDRPGHMLCWRVEDEANQDWALVGLEIELSIISQYG